MEAKICQSITSMNVNMLTSVLYAPLPGSCAEIDNRSVFRIGTREGTGLVYNTPLIYAFQLPPPETYVEKRKLARPSFRPFGRVEGVRRRKVGQLPLRDSCWLVANGVERKELEGVRMERVVSHVQERNTMNGGGVPKSCVENIPRRGRHLRFVRLIRRSILSLALGFFCGCIFWVFLHSGF